MNKNVKYIALAAVVVPLLTLVVWLIWVFLVPTLKHKFLNVVSNHTENLLYTEPARKRQI